MHAVAMQQRQQWRMDKRPPASCAAGAQLCPGPRRAGAAQTRQRPVPAAAAAPTCPDLMRGLESWVCRSSFTRSMGATAVLEMAPAVPPAIRSFTKARGSACASLRGAACHGAGHLSGGRGRAAQAGPQDRGREEATISCTKLRNQAATSQAGARRPDKSGGEQPPLPRGRPARAPAAAAPGSWVMRPSAALPLTWGTR